MARWVLTERGIIGPNAGPNAFVPWDQASSYEWQDLNTVAITTAATFAGARRFTISVAPAARESARTILAGKLPLRS
jgi:hypothetical protein